MDELHIDEELGFKYYDEQDYELAYYHLLKAANNHNGKCANKIGLMYYLGKYVEKDYSKALEWYLKAADLGFNNAYGNIGYYYDFIENDASVAFKWYEKGAMLSDPNCQCKVGLAYENGHGVSKDYFKAYYWYNEAVNQNYARAYYHLGKLYYNGNGIPQNYQKACDTYLTGAKLNDKFALQEFVMGYAKGDFQVSDDDLSWAVGKAKEVLTNNTYTASFIEKAEELLTNKDAGYIKETIVKKETISSSPVYPTKETKTISTPAKEEPVIKKEEVKKPIQRNESDIQLKLIDIYKTYGVSQAFSNETNKLIEAFKEEIENDLYDDLYEVAIAKWESIKYLRYSEAHLNMADCYYYLDDYDNVVRCAKEINLLTIDKDEYFSVLYDVAYVLYECENYEEAYKFALAAIKGGSEASKEIIEDIKNNHAECISQPNTETITSKKESVKHVEVQTAEPQKEVKNETPKIEPKIEVKNVVEKQVYKPLQQESKKETSKEDSNHPSINIAVIGMDGDGKSTFIASLANLCDKAVLPEELKQQKNVHHCTHVSYTHGNIQFNLFESTSEHRHVLEMIKAMNHIDAVILVYDVIKGLDNEIHDSICLQIRTLAKQEPKLFITFFNKCDKYDEDDVEECVDLGQEDLHAYISDYHDNEISFYQGSAYHAYNDSFSDNKFVMIDIIEDLFAHSQNWILETDHKNHMLAAQEYYEQALIYDDRENYAEAESYYLLAIDYGHIDAMYDYADLILRLSQNPNSNITTKDIYNLFEKAAHAGSQKAMQWLYEAYKASNNKEKADYWFIKMK